MEQPAHGLEVRMHPFVRLRAPKLFNPRADPFERSEIEAGAYDKRVRRTPVCPRSHAPIVAQHIASFQEFPPCQRPGSFSIEQAMDMLITRKGSN